MTLPTLHCVSLPHTEIVSGEWSFCAYTQKLVRFAPMMEKLGHKVVLYGGTRCNVTCTEHVETVTDAQREQWFGDYDWSKDVFSGWQPAEWWDVMNARAIQEIQKRIEPGDIICIIAGVRQDILQKAFPNNLVVEPFVGYDGIATQYCAFESYAWMHQVYGQYGIGDGRFFDAVIPNYFDTSDFDPTLERDDYLLFIGRLTPRKGPHVAADLAERTGRRLLVAGQGDPIPGTEHIGVVSYDERRELMGRAAAVIVPTLYLEPFGGVNVEAQLSGTPVITHDFGAFTETVSHGQTGFRCRTMGEMVKAVDELDTLWEPSDIAQWAAHRYSCDTLGPEFSAWFQRLGTLTQGGEGYYAETPLKSLHDIYKYRH